jgi:hypothetical protein
LSGKIHAGPLYLEAPATAEPPLPKPVELEPVERAVDAFVAGAEPLPARKAVEQGADGDFLASLGETIAPLVDFVTLPMDGSHRVSCPFHDDPHPSCSIYPDHFYCHGCGARGDRLDWLMQVEGMTRDEAVAALQDWSGPLVTPQPQQRDEDKTAFALSIWNAAGPLHGTIGERYLSETRGIDVSRLPPTIHDALRFHPRCIFGNARHPCIVALMRDPVTDAVLGIQRIGLAQANGEVAKIDRMALGHMGVVKLWPVGGGRLVVGEGVETVLAAACGLSFRGAPLMPAWSVVTKNGMASLPVLANVPSLVLLVDNDANGEGQRAAQHCRHTWGGSGRSIVLLVPKQPGHDFNDAVLGRKA